MKAFFNHFLPILLPFLAFVVLPTHVNANHQPGGWAVFKEVGSSEPGDEILEPDDSTTVEDETEDESIPDGTPEEEGDLPDDAALGGDEQCPEEDETDCDPPVEPEEGSSEDEEGKTGNGNSEPGD